MLIPFDELPYESRLWVYQANKMLSESEQVLIEDYLSMGVRDWSAHGVSLAGSFQIVHNRFVIIAVNESIHAPSGCSIDASTRWLKELGTELNIDFLDRSIIYIKDAELKSIPTLSAKKHIENGDLQAENLIFDNLVNTVGDFKEAFMKPAAQTWMKRFFKTSLMTNIKIICCFCLLLQSQLFAQSINIMTFNIRYNTERDSINKWDNRKDHVADMIKFYEADFCGVQEALIGQVDDLQERLPAYAHFGLGRDDGKEKGEFSSIFYNKTRFELLKQETFWLSPTPEKPSKGWDANLPRIVTWGYFKDLKTKMKFFVFNTHFDHIGQVARAESSKLILRKIKEIAGKGNAILIGDFNASPDMEPIKIILTEYLNTKALSQTPHFGPNDSFTGFGIKEHVNREIDYIFINNAKAKVQKHATLSNIWAGLFASDHHPVMAKILFEK